MFLLPQAPRHSLGLRTPPGSNSVKGNASKWGEYLGRIQNLLDFLKRVVLLSCRLHSLDLLLHENFDVAKLGRATMSAKRSAMNWNQYFCKVKVTFLLETFHMNRHFA